MFDFELPFSMETLFIGLAVVAVVAGVGIWYWRYSKQAPALPVQNVMKAENVEEKEDQDRGTPGQKTTETASKA